MAQRIPLVLAAGEMQQSATGDTLLLGADPAAPLEAATKQYVDAHVGGGGTTVKVAGSDFTINTNVLTNITGLTVAVAANSKYEVDAVLVFQSGSTAGLQFALAYSAAGANGGYLMIGNSGTSGIASNAAAALGTGLGTFGTSPGSFMTLFVKGTVITGANAGNITLQIARLTTGVATVYIGSRMTVTPL